MVDKKEPKYVYRLLNESEKPERGLWAKNPKADISIQEHVETGSWGTESQFISTSATLGAVQQFARNSKSRRKRIVEINLTEVEKIPGNKIYDLSVERNRKMHLRSEKSLNFARKFQEVLIQGNVPPEWIEIQVKKKNS
ncbi:hypothetical protein FSP39_013071 [Pinctada imbricata]|uniref:DUF7587 domain-containing protein n=1 Tax=Pinctada imbricata TaxID=66713 RepID=A0AA88YHC9_PINIB|nr:hypothetical protein FSP39_013071 [Pinctada imbricata]